MVVGAGVNVPKREGPEVKRVTSDVVQVMPAVSLMPRKRVRTIQVHAMRPTAAEVGSRWLFGLRGSVGWRVVGGGRRAQLSQRSDGNERMRSQWRQWHPDANVGATPASLR